MPNSRCTLTLITATLTLPALLVTTGRADDNEVPAIRRLLDTQVADGNRMDLDAFLNGDSHAPGVVFQSGVNRRDGFEAVRSRYRPSYQAEGRAMGRLAFTALEVIMLGPDAALARGRFPLTMSDGKRPRGLFTRILCKRPEGWRIVHDPTSS